MWARSSMAITNSKRVSNWRHRTKERLVHAAGGKCCICEYSRCMDALEFHHLDKNTKEVTISSVLKIPRKLAYIINEVKKCTLLCSNCHKEVHKGITQLPKNIVGINADELKGYVPKSKEEKQNRCPICGNKKLTTRKTCSIICAGKKNRKVDWDNINERALANSGLSNVEIGKQLGCSEGAVRMRFQRRGIYKRRYKTQGHVA